MEANSEGWALGEISACDGLEAERVETMAKVKLGGSRARPRKAKVRPYATIHSFSDTFKNHCENLIGGLDVEVTPQAFKICAGNVGHRWVQVRKVVKRNMYTVASSVFC